MAQKVIIITGASRGIGLSAAHKILSTPSHRVLAIARSSEPLQTLQSQYPDRVQILSGDLSDFALGQKAVDLALLEWGQLDGVVINHGVLDPVKRIADTEAEEWRRAFDINAFSGIAMVNRS